MNSTPAIPAAPPPEFRAADVARKLARSPDNVHTSASGAKDSVELSAEAIALFISRNAIESNIELIKTENGVGNTLLDLLR